MQNTGQTPLQQFFGRPPRKKITNRIVLPFAERALHTMAIIKLQTDQPDLSSEKGNKILNDLFPTVPAILTGQNNSQYWYSRRQDAAELSQLLHEAGLWVFSTNQK